MNVTKIRLLGLYTVDLPISVAQPSDPYIIKAADGLGFPGVDVSIVGSVYQGRRPRNRELVFKIGLTPNFKLNQTAADLRQQLYGMVVPASGDDYVPVHFLNGDVVIATTSGLVETIEPAMFSKEPEVVMTMPCTEAYLRGPSQISMVPASDNGFTIVNQGTAPTGIEFEVAFSQALPEFKINQGSRSMTFQYDFLAGDVLRVDTREGQRSIKVVRGGVIREAIGSLTRTSKWFEMHGGSNVFVTATQNFDRFSYNFVRYTPLYLGV